MKTSASDPRRPSRRRASVLAALVVGALLATAGAAQAALPPKGATFTFHDHETAGENWHVDVRIHPKDNTKVKTLVLYSEVCDATIARRNVPISPDGVVSANGSLAGGGTWEVRAEFTAKTKLSGVMSMKGPDCDTGPLTFPNEVTGDGHGDHEHGKAGGGHEGHVGPMYADFKNATPGQRGQAAGFHRHVLERWSGVSFADAKRSGFRRGPMFKEDKKLGMFHLYRERWEKDGRIFDAQRPESLVFWRRPHGPPVLVATMFRVAPGPRPNFAGPIPIYHFHGSGPPNSQMTHVWLVKDVEMGWANCLPSVELHDYNPAFEWIEGAAVGHSSVCDPPHGPTKG